MIHITLTDARPADPNDGLGRDIVGYSPTMTEADLHEANRGCWVLGQRADRERFALFSYKGQVVQAMRIDAVVPAGDRRALEGPVLSPGHPVYDAFVGRPAPLQHRNPVGYFSDPADHRECACGCGQVIGKGDFAAGHDQRALHARVSRIGTVKQFIEWFDEVHPDEG